MTKAFSLHMKDSPSFLVNQVEQRVILHYFRIQANSNKFYIMEFQLGVGDTLTVSILNTVEWEVLRENMKDAF